jgi:uncharacterized protein (DUF1330 family)
MRITEFNITPTAKQLNEDVAKKFGQRINLESFTIEQLEDARNKLRTKLSQFESNSQFNEVYESEGYAKNKLFLDVLNAAIDERAAAEPQFTEMEQMVLNKVEEGAIAFEDLPEQLQEKAKSKAQQKFMGMVYAAKKGEKAAGPEVAKTAKGMSTKSAKDYASTKHKGKPEHVGESIIREGEEEKAELIMAARDMVDRITGWMEDTANMQAESMLELIDSIRDELGSDVAMEFESSVKPALATIYTALESSRGQLTTGVAIITGENEPAMMGDEQLGGDELGGDELGGDEIDGGEVASDEFAADDDFAADAAAAGGEEAAGRATRESIEYSRRLGTLLAPKKK